MCGIVGYVGVKQAAPILLSGLMRLEYRGYDSAFMNSRALFGIRFHRESRKMSRANTLI